MKKILLIALVIVIASFATAMSQGKTGITEKGFKIGLNMSKYTGSDATNTKTKSGLVLGGYITYSLSDIFALQPELQYTMKGAKGEFYSAEYDITIDLTDKLNYLEIPILAKFFVNTRSSVKPSFYAGPAISFLMSAKEKGEAQGVSAEVDIKDYIKSTDFGLIFGAGTDFLAGSGRITFDIRYEMGLSSIDDVSNAADIKNSNLSLMVGYGF